MHMHPLRLSLFALLLLAVFGMSQEAEAAPEATIISVSPQVINLDIATGELDWRNESYIYENQDGFNLTTIPGQITAQTVLVGSYLIQFGIFQKR